MKGIGEKTLKRLGINPEQKTNEIKKQIKDKIDTGELTSKTAEMYLKYNPIDKIERHVIAKIEKEVYKIYKDCLITGSYRRGVTKSSDIDLVFIGTQKNALNFLDKCIAIFEDIVIVSEGPSKIMTLVKYEKKYIQLDIFLCKKRSYASMVLYTTGSFKFNIIMRSKAKKLGYLLNQNGIKIDGKLRQFMTEKKYFDILGMKYVEPYLR